MLLLADYFLVAAFFISYTNSFEIFSVLWQQQQLLCLYFETEVLKYLLPSALLALHPWARQLQTVSYPLLGQYTTCPIFAVTSFRPYQRLHSFKYAFLLCHVKLLLSSVILVSMCMWPLALLVTLFDDFYMANYF